MKTTDKPLKRTDQVRAPRRKLLATLTAAALLTMAGAPHADAAPPIALTFAPLGSQSHPDELAFDIPLASGESVADIRYLANGAETSLLSSFELTPGASGVSARFLPKLDFTPYLGQTLTLKVLKSDSTFAAQSEEQLLLRIVSTQDLQHDLKLVAVTDGTPQADALEFAIPGAVNATLDDLLLVGAKGNTSVKTLLTLSAERSGDTTVSLRDADLDTLASKPLELRAVKTLKGGAAPLTQKLTLAPTSAREFTLDATLTVPTSGDKQPDPFTLALAAGANVAVNEITLDQPGGTVSVLDLFTLTRAADGNLSATLKTALDLDPYVGQPLVLHVQMTVAGQSYTRKITLNAVLQDRPTKLEAPKLIAKDDGNITVENAIGDPDGVRNVLYLLYSAAKTEKARNSSGAFTGLSANTAYYVGATAETLDRATRKWTAQASPLLPVTTDQAMPAAFSFNPVSGAALTSGYTSNTITLSGLHGLAAISITGGEYALDGGAWSSAAGTVHNGQTVQVRGTAAGSYSTAGKVTLTVGGHSGDFTITTTSAPVVYYDPPPPSDTTLPTTSAHSTANITDTTADIRATIDEAGTGYYIVQLAVTAAPSVAQIMAGQDGSGGAALKSGNAAMTASTQKTFSVSGLTASTSYKAYFVAKDGSNNVQAAAVSDALDTTADATPPTTSAHSVAIDEAGTGYYVVQLTATAAPSVVQIVAGQDGSGAAAPKSGNAAMTAATQKVFSVSGLAASTNYTAYFVAKDAANNTQAAAVSDALNTTAPDGTIPATPTLSIKSGDAYVNKTYADAHTSGGTIQVPVTISNDTDNVGVTGWFVSESSSVPVLGDFVTPKPTTVNISTDDGTKTAYTWTRDAAGNLSLAGSDTIIIDTTPPAAPAGLALDGGAASTTAGSVTLGGLTTPADADLAAWFVSESDVAPAAGDAGWVGAKPTTYSFATGTTETKTVCVYVKDTADNVQGTGACDTIDKVP